MRKIEHGQIRCIARDLPEPSPLASEILNARPYVFLDNASEERRTQAVTRRASERNGSEGLGVLDAAAIEKVQKGSSGSRIRMNCTTLMLLGVMTEEEVAVSAS